MDRSLSRSPHRNAPAGRSRSRRPALAPARRARIARSPATLLFALASLAVACGHEGARRDEPSYASFPLDPRALQVESIRQTFQRTGAVAPEDMDLLMTLSRTYPEEAAVQGLLERVLLRRQDWNALVALRSRKPAAQRTTSEERDLAKLLIKAQRFDEAVPHLDLVIAENPSEAEARWLYGYASYYRGDYTAAIETFERFGPRLQEGGYGKSTLLCGLSHLQLEHMDRAIALLSEYVRREPDDLSGCNGLARALVAVGREKEAEPLLARVAELHDRQNAEERRRSFLAARVQDLNRAMEEKRTADCERIIKETLPAADPGLKARLLTILGDVYQSTGRVDEARQAREDAAEAARMQERGAD